MDKKKYCPDCWDETGMLITASFCPHTEWWGNRECAAHCDMTEALWRDAVSRGRAPAPQIHLGGSPGWLPDTVREWNATERRGPGRPRKNQSTTEETTPVTDHSPCQCHRSFTRIISTHSGHCCFRSADATCHPIEVAAWEAERDRVAGLADQVR